MVVMVVVSVMMVLSRFYNFFALEIFGLLLEVVLAHKELTTRGVLLMVVVVVVMVRMVIRVVVVMVVVVVYVLLFVRLLFAVLVAGTHATVIGAAARHRLVGDYWQVFEVRLIVGASCRGRRRGNQLALVLPVVHLLVHVVAARCGRFER